MGELTQDKCYRGGVVDEALFPNLLPFFLVRPGNTCYATFTVRNTIPLMKSSLLSLLVAVVSIVAAQDTQADATFSGALLTGHNEGWVAGNITLTVDRGQVGFTSTLFQSCVSGTVLEPALLVHNKVYPLDFGTGTTGSWQLGEFFAPLPGVAPYCGPPPIDEGWGIQPYYEGTRFAGSFTTHPNLEQMLLSKGGTVLLQVRGNANGVQDPLFSAPLQEAPVSIPFAAELSGANERPPNPSAFEGSGTFTLTGNCLSYSFTVSYGFAWTSAGIFGPAGRHSTSANLVADLQPWLFGFTPGAEQASNGGKVPLSDDAVDELKRGKLYLSLATAQYPQGELRGQILPVRPVHDSRPDRHSPDSGGTLPRHRCELTVHGKLRPPALDARRGHEPIVGSRTHPRRPAF